MINRLLRLDFLTKEQEVHYNSSIMLKRYVNAEVYILNHYGVEVDKTVEMLILKRILFLDVFNQVTGLKLSDFLVWKECIKRGDKNGPWLDQDMDGIDETKFFLEAQTLSELYSYWQKFRINGFSQDGMEDAT